MKKAEKLLAAVLVAVLLGSLAGCIVAERPYPGDNYRYRDPRWRNGRYDGDRDRGRYDDRHRDRDRDRD